MYAFKHTHAHICNAEEYTRPAIMLYIFLLDNSYPGVLGVLAGIRAGLLADAAAGHKVLREGEREKEKEGEIKRKRER